MGERNKISVVMATYNGEKYIKEQLDSILHQSILPDEIVICDDCSTDSTWDIIQQYKEKHPSLIRPYRNISNIGPNVNFIRAFHLSMGDYIAPADQDDIWFPEKLQNAINVLEYNQETDLVYCQEKVLYSDNEIQIVDRDIPALHSVVLRNFLCGHTCVFRRSILDYLSVDNDIAYDHGLALVVLCKNSIQRVESIDCIWRRHQGVCTQAVVRQVTSNATPCLKNALLLLIKCNHCSFIEREMRGASIIFSLLDGEINKMYASMCMYMSRQTLFHMLLASVYNFRIKNQSSSCNSIKETFARMYFSFKELLIWYYETAESERN